MCIKINLKNIILSSSSMTVISQVSFEVLLMHKCVFRSYDLLSIRVYLSLLITNIEIIDFASSISIFTSLQHSMMLVFASLTFIISKWMSYCISNWVLATKVSNITLISASLSSSVLMLISSLISTYVLKHFTAYKIVFNFLSEESLSFTAITCILLIFFIFFFLCCFTWV